ncbi:MAG: hypothetical protein ACRDUX_34895, partial [Mycobacterium sp.]
VFDVHPLFARAHTFVRTDDFYGLLQLPFVEEPGENVVTVNVGDDIALVRSEPTSSQAEADGTYR